MKKDCSEQQHRVLRKLLRCHKPSVQDMSAPTARKATLPFPVGRRTTRSAAAKLRAERDSQARVPPQSKFDSNSKHSDDSTESTDSQSEQKQNSTKTNDNQSDTNVPPETSEEKTKKPRKKRISRALFRHDTIELIKPKKQELLQKSFSFKFKKLVDKSKEIYTRNDELINDNENDDDKTKENLVNQDMDCRNEVKSPSKNTENSSTNNNEEKTVHNKRLILDMPSLDSPSSPITNQTNERLNIIDKSNKIEKLNKMEAIKHPAPTIQLNIIAQTNDRQIAQVQEVTKPTKSKDTLSVPRNDCQIQTNSIQNLAYPFFGMIPNRKAITSVRRQTIEDQIPTYKITIVPDHPKNKTSDNRTVPPQHNYLVPHRQKPPHQLKIKTAQNANQTFPYPYLPPSSPYGYPYHLYPYLPPIQTQNNFAVPEKPIWNPHVQDIQPKVNISPKEALKYKIQLAQENGEKHRNRNEPKMQVNVNCTIVKDQNQHKNQLAHNLERLNHHLNPLKVVKANIEHLKSISSPENLSQESIRRQLPVNFVPVGQNQPPRYQEQPHPELLNKKRPAEEPKIIKRVRFESPENNCPPNNSASQKPESVIVINKRLETKEQRVIVPNDQINLHNRNKYMQDTPPENNKIMQSTCSVIKKVCTNKNQHTIENILSNKCSTNKTEVNNNDDPKNSKIKILNVETITSKDSRYVRQNSGEDLAHRSVIINAQSNKIAHIDLTTEPNEDRASNSLNKSQFNDKISLNDNTNTNRLAHTQSINCDKQNTQQHVAMSTEASKIPISGLPMPKLIKIPEKYLTKLEETKRGETTDNRVYKHAAETKDNEKSDRRVRKYPLEIKDSEKSDNRVHKYPLETKDSETSDNGVLRHAIETKHSETSDNRVHRHAIETKHSETNDNRVLRHAIEIKHNETSDNRVLRHAIETKDSGTSDNRIYRSAVDTKDSDKSDNRVHRPAVETRDSETSHNQVQNYALEAKPHEKCDNRMHKYALEIKHCEKSDNQVHNYALEIKYREKSDNQMHKYTLEANDSEKSDDRVHKYALETKYSETIDNRVHKYTLETNNFEKRHNQVNRTAIESKYSESCNNQVHKHVTETKDSEKNDRRVHKHVAETKYSETSENQGHKHAAETKDSEKIEHRMHNFALETKYSETSENRVHKHAAETKDSDKSDSRVHKHPLETKDVDKIAVETNKSDKYAYNDVPLLKAAHTNNKNKISEVPTELPLNLSLKTVAQNEQNKRQSIIVNNTKIHEPLDISTLTLVKSDEEYNGYLKLLQEKNATGPYLFYKFVTGVRRRNNQPIFDLVTFFSLLKQGKLLEYKNMYNQCNK